MIIIMLNDIHIHINLTNFYWQRQYFKFISLLLDIDILITIKIPKSTIFNVVRELNLC